MFCASLHESAEIPRSTLNNTTYSFNNQDLERYYCSRQLISCMSANQLITDLRGERETAKPTRVGTAVPEILLNMVHGPRARLFSESFTMWLREQRVIPAGAKAYLYAKRNMGPISLLINIDAPIDGGWGVGGNSI